MKPAAEPRHELRILAFAIANCVPTLFGVWLLEVGRRERAFGWPWMATAPDFVSTGAFVVLMFAVLAGAWMTWNLMQSHTVLTPVRRRLATGAYVVLAMVVGQEIWAPFFDLTICSEMVPSLIIGRLMAVPSTAFLAHTYLAIYREIDDRLANERELTARLFERSTTDALTGLANRGYFLEELERALETARATGGSLAVYFVDLDRFKPVNDTLGHEIGDQLLRKVAHRLRSGLRAGDSVGRIGGDEFLVMATGLDPRSDQAQTVANRLVEVVTQPIHIGPHELVCTASVGFSVFPADGADVGTLVRKADWAMYDAKQRGRSSTRRFAPEMSQGVERRVQLEQELRQGLTRGELFLEYQPQVDIRTGQVVSVEALVRWKSPRLGLIGPDLFIPLAEETGLIVDIDRFVLRAACQQLRAWRTHFADLRVAVNFSARNFSRDDVVATVREELHRSGLPGAALDIEITERALMGGKDGTEGALTELRQMGVTLSLDDFGTGYSALGYLNRFRVDALKIDRSLISATTQGASQAAVAQALITLGRQLDLQVVAEGVETEAQLDWLRTQGCRFVQGYLFSRPVSAGTVEQLLTVPPAEWVPREIRRVS